MLCINNFFLLYTVNRVNVICHKIYYLNLKIRKKYIILVLKHKIEQTKKKTSKELLTSYKIYTRCLYTGFRFHPSIFILIILFNFHNTPHIYLQNNKIIFRNINVISTSGISPYKSNYSHIYL